MIKSDNFPIQKSKIYLAHCGIAPLYAPAKARMQALIDKHSNLGEALFIDHYTQELDQFKNRFSHFIGAQPSEVASVRNTTEGMSFIANGYPFEPGDEIITYQNEYPANFYPWKRLEQQGVIIKELSNQNFNSAIPNHISGGWSWSSLLSMVTDRTKFICLSHVQFVSGYCADLQQLGEYCREKNIFLVIDAAQSLGILPIDVKKYNIAALAASGWKWMMGPVGNGFFYIRRDLMDHVRPTVVGAESMTQSFDYLDHQWAPQNTAKKYEYSTASIYSIAAMNLIMEEIINKDTLHAHYEKVQALHQYIYHYIDLTQYLPLQPQSRPSSFLSFYHPQSEQIVTALKEKNIITSSRGGCLRLAPHFYNTEEEIDLLIKQLNKYTCR